MSCGGEMQKFRLLDGLVGWDIAHCEKLTGLAFDDVSGLRLAQTRPDGSYAPCHELDPFVSAADVLPYIPPGRLAHGCGRCDWFLVHEEKLLRHDCCAPVWRPVWNRKCDQQLLQNGVAVAARDGRVAVADAKAHRIWIWDNNGERLIAAIDTDDLSGIPDCKPCVQPNSISSPGPVAFTAWHELLAVDLKTNSIFRFGFAGELYGKLSTALPSKDVSGNIQRLAVARDCSIWIVSGVDELSVQLWRATRDDSMFRRATIAELAKAFEPTGLTAANEKDGFCLGECGPEGFPISVCFRWDGCPAPKAIENPPAPGRQIQGQLLTAAIDSGIPRCRWHRVQLEADVPAGTSLEIAVATNEAPSKIAPPSRDEFREPGWEKFEAGVPHHLDWQVAPAGSIEFLIDQPPGRVLYLRLRLRGNGFATPVVNRIRLDFPRVTSLDLLPPVYCDNPQAEDFTERFLSLFDTQIADLDRAIERSPALLDPAGVPDDVLPWLGGFLDLVFDPAWSPELRRKILQALPELYRRRGTLSGLVDTIKLVFDNINPEVQELAAERNWGAVAANTDRTQLRNSIQLGSSRLFGKSRARFRLNTSALSTAPIRSYGNPDHDPLLAQAFRLRVLVPPLNSLLTRQKVEQLIASQKPAHTVSTIHFGGEGFIIGNRSALGIDSLIAPLPKPVLGASGNIRLSRMTVLWHGPNGTPRGLRLGETSIVGMRRIAA